MSGRPLLEQDDEKIEHCDEIHLEKKQEEQRWAARHFVAAATLLVAGSLNTIFIKWADRITARGSSFFHPFLQAFGMFTGELLCLGAYFAMKLMTKRAKTVQTDIPFELLTENEHDTLTPPKVKFNPLVLLPAAGCDLISTCLMYIGINFTHAASFQMLKGAVIIFTGLLSVVLLRSVIHLHRWLGIALVLLGLVLVCLADVLGQPEGHRQSMLIGDLLIIFAQFTIAFQVVYEQQCVVKYDINPILAVGVEGMFGVLMLGLMLGPLHFIRYPGDYYLADSEHHFENFRFAAEQIQAKPMILLPLLGPVLFMALYKPCGLYMSKQLSALTRQILDSMRIILVWAFSLAAGWSHFAVLQLFGFVVLVSGMVVYNMGPRIAEAVADRMPCLERYLAWCYKVKDNSLKYEESESDDSDY